jgi:hypothetical protein
MMKKTPPILHLVVALAALPPSLAWARFGGAERQLTVGAGYSSPSQTSNPGENPAGLTAAIGKTAQPSVHSPDDDFDPLGIGGDLYFGNGHQGARLGYDHEGDADRFDVGLATEIAALHASLGVTATWAKDPGADFDAGLMINPRGIMRIGVVAQGLAGGPDGYAGGVAWDLSPGSTFAVDASVDRDFKGLRIMPALGVEVADLALTVGYGVRADDQHGSAIREGFGMGVGYRLDSSLSLSGYYNTIVDRYLLQLGYQF